MSIPPLVGIRHLDAVLFSLLVLFRMVEGKELYSIRKLDDGRARWFRYCRSAGGRGKCEYGDVGRDA